MVGRLTETLDVEMHLMAENVETGVGPALAGTDQRVRPRTFRSDVTRAICELVLPIFSGVALFGLVEHVVTRDAPSAPVKNDRQAASWKHHALSITASNGIAYNDTCVHI